MLRQSIGTGEFVVYNPFQNIIRTFMEHPEGYSWIRFQIEAQGWKAFPVD